MVKRDRSLLLASSLAVLVCTMALVGAPVGAETTPGENPNVTVVAHYPTDDGYQNETLVTKTDVAAVGTVEEQNGMYRIPVTLTEEAGASFASALVERGFTGEGVSSCRWERNRDDAGYCLLTVVDGEVTFAASLAPGLASSMESGDFEEDPRFILAAQSKEEAERIAEQLRGGEATTSGSGDSEATTADATGGDDGGDGESSDADDGSDGEGTAANSSGSTPGFTAGDVALALLSVALFVRR
ncbi:hypothetical protein [Haloarchaeobius sp. HME9146]|uniref:hypothetical protein n=1 Tax=Haloarchaeobius sp. HME9146 TaxID=2978732 RepID=UPI0021C1DCFD|nr:hypothetical protein [Haloarchaeobius sp. HME9146]MCT9096555.1 hypothetical protein [Haloarchaeobius sp. HME9146]